MRNQTENSRWTVRILLALALCIAVATAGCGGGGGGNSGNGNGGNGGGVTQDPNLAIVKGQLTSGGQPVVGAIVTAGGRMSAPTGSNGSFTVNNVPPGTTGFTITIPTGAGYSNSVSYGNATYDTTNKNNPLPLGGTLTAGGTLTLTNGIMVFPSSNVNNPPPPPNP